MYTFLQPGQNGYKVCCFPSQPGAATLTFRSLYGDSGQFFLISWLCAWARVTFGGAQVRVPTDPKLKITEVVTSPKYLCCGAVRHFQLQIDMPEDELAHQRSLDVQVVAEAGSQTLATTNATVRVELGWWMQEADSVPTCGHHR